MKARSATCIAPGMLAFRRSVLLAASLAKEPGSSKVDTDPKESSGNTGTAAGTSSCL